MRLADLLYLHGFGTRRICAGRIERGQVRVQGQVLTDPRAEVATEGLVFEVDGVTWPFCAKALIALHKPSGHECSQKPLHHPSVMTLLPEPLRKRGVQPVGRLDADTTGLLLLTDDGSLIHRLTRPKHHVPKVYQVTCKHPIDDAQIATLCAGVSLREPDRPPQQVQALQAQTLGTHQLRLVLGEGKYHQVKRMVAAVGNRVEALHRTQIGAYVLPDDLLPGQWRFIGSAREVLG